MSRVLLSATPLAALFVGCTFFQPWERYLPIPPGETERAAYGSIAVVVHEAAPELAFRPQVVGWASGLGWGTVRGVAGGVLMPVFGAIGGLPGGPFGVAGGAAIGAAAGAVYVPASIIVGSVTAPDPEEVARAEAVIASVLAHNTGPARLGLRFQELARQNAQRECSLAGTVTGDGDAGAIIDPRALQADTVIELRWLAVRNGATVGMCTFDRLCECELDIGVNVVRVSDRRVLYSTELECYDELRVRRYVEWAAEGGDVLERELDRALTDACEVLVDEIFLIDVDLLLEAGGKGVSPILARMRPEGTVAW